MLNPTQKMHSSASSSGSKAPPATTEISAESALLDLEKGFKKSPPGAGREKRRRAVVAAAIVDVCLAAAALAGAAVLTWWSIAFHPSFAHLWMVPVGLVLACTPIVVCVALHFSSSGADTRAPPPTLSAVVVDKL